MGGGGLETGFFFSMRYFILIGRWKFNYLFIIRENLYDEVLIFSFSIFPWVRCPIMTKIECDDNWVHRRSHQDPLLLQVHSDFVAAATRGAMAVIDGNVMAINPGEEAKMQMFIWNNIFFSLGFDVRNHYKELGGDSAAFIAPVSWITDE